MGRPGATCTDCSTGGRLEALATGITTHVAPNVRRKKSGVLRGFRVAYATAALIALRARIRYTR